MNGVEVVAVRKNFGTARVLSDIHARFAEGAFTSLLGPSGSGKTTLLRIIAGFVTPDAGAVRIGARDVTRLPVHARNIGMVFQSYALFPHMTVAANIAFGLHRRGRPAGEVAARCAAVLDMVQMAHLAQRYPKQLSGGQQQRVALARAIVIDPAVLLLDEPLSALDRRLRQEMQVELKRIQRASGLTTIFVTHDQEEALTLSDHLAILDGGRIVQEGPPSAVYEHPRTRFAAGFLGDANFLTGRTTPAGIEVAGRPIRTAERTNAATATVAVRPEKIAICTAGTCDNELPAIVRQVIYAGAATTYLLDAAGGTPMRVFSQNRDGPSFAPGTAVTLGWSAAHSVIVAD